MNEQRKTIFHDRHVSLGAKMVDFAGWDMPLQYPDGILAEHLFTRKHAGVFDVSHMGRFVFRGAGVLAFLQHVLTNNATALQVGWAQYTIIPNATGGAIDDAYLYRFIADEFLLVVNAANRQKDWEHFQAIIGGFDNVEMSDVSEEMAMISLQGPRAEEILSSIIGDGSLPPPRRNALSTAAIDSAEVQIARTGYTGEAICFELFMPAQAGLKIWDTLVQRGAKPIGLGARDTLRLEAGLPLYGHEMGLDVEGNEIPIFACPLAKFAVSFADSEGEKIGKIGKTALAKQQAGDLPRIIMPITVDGKAVARHGAKIFDQAGKLVGYVTSGTIVPYWRMENNEMTDETAMKPVCFGLIDSGLGGSSCVEIEIRGKRIPAHLNIFKKG